MKVKKQELYPDMKQQTGSKMGKEYVKAVNCHIAYLTTNQSTSWKIPGWIKPQLESKTVWNTTSELLKTVYIDDITLNDRKRRGNKEPLDDGERGERKSWHETQCSINLDHGIWSDHFIVNRRKSGNSKRFYFQGSKITLNIKLKIFAPWNKSYDNLDSILKYRDIALLTMVHIIRAMVFPVAMYGCEIWTIKKAEHWRIDAFELWCWRRLLSVPWTERRSKQSILKEINSEYSLEGLVLKLQSFGHLT